MFDHLSRNFRLLLRAFDGEVCPLCAVRGALERDQLERARSKARPVVPCCREHLAAYVSRINSAADQALEISRALEALSADDTGCYVCKHLCAAEAKLARSIRRLDGKLRFRKALEAAPLFCREHEQLVLADKRADNFAAVQRAKLRRLRDELRQAALRASNEVGELLEAALAYLGRPMPETPHPDEDSAEAADAESRVFETWDNRQQLKRLGDLEAEAASLRYRNAVLAEENRRLRLARIALEATQRDLEKDRTELLAQKGRLTADATKG